MPIRPRPIPPYWPMFPEPQRSRIEADYRAADEEWQREAMLIGSLNLAMALIGPLAIGAAALLLLC